MTLVAFWGVSPCSLVDIIIIRGATSRIIRGTRGHGIEFR